MKEKVIQFVSSTSHLATGSYRIWVNDLNSYFNKVSIPSFISSDYNQESDIVICGKSDWQTAVKIKILFPEKKVGVINLSADKRDLPIDFVIVGSLEEADSLSCYKNVFLFPLIEDMYQSPQDYKTHAPVERLRIGFHGHYPHLNKFYPHLGPALEELEKKHKLDFELYIITSNTNPAWHIGKPNIKNIKIKRWDFNTIKQDLLSCDVGVVPNITNLTLEELKLKNSTDLGLYNTDYVLRMKNKSNAGRCFVFHQLGVPVVADFTPSNFHILGDPDNGYVAFNKETWLKALLELSNHKKRQDIANSAKKEFDRLYNPYDWAKKLYNNIGDIK